MPPVATKSKIGYFLYKDHGQGHKVVELVVIWKDLFIWICVPNMNLYLSRFKSYGQG